MKSFAPDWISPPGDTIMDLLEERGWSQVDFATRMGMSLKHINEIIKGKKGISNDTAVKLERVLGSTAEFWLNRELQYQQSLARISEAKRLGSWDSWARQFPIRELMKAGYLTKQNITHNNLVAIVDELLRLFSIASPEEWDSTYAKMSGSFRCTRPDQSDTIAISSWIRLGEIVVENVNSPKYNQSSFVSSLEEIRSLALSPFQDIENNLKEICLKSGVVLVIVPSIPRARVSGVTRWVKSQPVIQLSLYGKSNDRIWFTFFHEVAHLLKHDRKEIFLDEFDGKGLDIPEEHEADNWAADFLIPSKYFKELHKLKTEKAIIEFAKKVNTHPGIVVGRLQHEEFIKQSQMNHLKVSYQTESHISSN
ncbi:HigA family addiction module antitoxin [Methanoregula sp.]|uniref:HigA family addiction module antitoxin n=1 Tax=Methanoregula sp. TaxID=2052170 RepID=UPI002CAA0F14|nr:HigA family addiction module antitoxin [Methanoregula sp.]HVP96759.1 HigA family addiction module antitoxin [Methanoregula sp.]